MVFIDISLYFIVLYIQDKCECFEGGRGEGEHKNQNKSENYRWLLENSE